MKTTVWATIGSLALFTAPLLAQDDGDGSGEIIVTGSYRPTAPVVVEKPPVIGLRRQADSAVRNIDIVSDSREEDMRRREVQAMLLVAIDRAKREGLSLVTGQYELVEVTRANWQTQFAGLDDKSVSDDDEDDDNEDEDEDENNKPKPAFENDGSDMRIHLKVKTKLDGSISNAQQKITRFVKAVPVTGRSQIEQKGRMALTIIRPDQYRDEIYRRIAEGAKHAVGFYGGDYNLGVTGLDREIAWKQVSNTEVFLYIPYSFSVGK